MSIEFVPLDVCITPSLSRSSERTLLVEEEMAVVFSNLSIHRYVSVCQGIEQEEEGILWLSRRQHPQSALCCPETVSRSPQSGQNWMAILLESNAES